MCCCWPPASGCAWMPCCLMPRRCSIPRPQRGKPTTPLPGRRGAARWGCQSRRAGAGGGGGGSGGRLLAALSRLLAEAESAKGRIASLADRAARLYVPVVHALAAATFLLWAWGIGVSWQEALVPAVAVLIITCPCALAIAVAGGAKVVATGARLFRKGVLAVHPTALEAAGQPAGRAVLDKTGPPLTGRPAGVAAQIRRSIRPCCAVPPAWHAPRATLLARRRLVRACPEAPAEPGVIETRPGARSRGSARLGKPYGCSRGWATASRGWNSSSARAKGGNRWCSASATVCAPTGRAAGGGVARAGPVHGTAVGRWAAGGGGSEPPPPASRPGRLRRPAPAGKAARIADLVVRCYGRRPLMVGGWHQ